MSSIQHHSKGFLYVEDVEWYGHLGNKASVTGVRDGKRTCKIPIENLNELCKFFKRPVKYHPDDKDDPEDIRKFFDVFLGKDVTLDMTVCNFISRPEIFEVLPTRFRKVVWNVQVENKAFDEWLDGIEMEVLSLFAPEWMFVQKETIPRGTFKKLKIGRHLGDTVVPPNIDHLSIVEYFPEKYSAPMKSLKYDSVYDMDLRVILELLELPETLKLACNRVVLSQWILDQLVELGCKHLNIQERTQTYPLHDLNIDKFVSVIYCGRHFKGKEATSSLTSLLAQ